MTGPLTDDELRGVRESTRRGSGHAGGDAYWNERWLATLDEATKLRTTEEPAMTESTDYHEASRRARYDYAVVTLGGYDLPEVYGPFTERDEAEAFAETIPLGHEPGREDNRYSAEVVELRRP